MLTLTTLLGAFILPSAQAGAHLSRAEGIVEVRRAAGGEWSSARALEQLEAGDRLRTGLGAAAGVDFDDGTALQLGPDASFVVDEASDKAYHLRLDLGIVRANVQPQAAGRFELRTPTALLRVRGTDFEVRVLAGGRTLVELYQGALAVEDNQGNQTLLKPNERLQIDVRGLQVPERRPSRLEASKAGFRALAHREALLDAEGERERSSTDRELRLGELQQGRALVDLDGVRVRVEEYVVRPANDRFKLVVLNERERRRDWFYYEGTFNRPLPDDLSVALNQLPGCVDRQCDWFLTSFATGRSNGTDTLSERGVNTLGGQIDVNANGDFRDDVSSLFDASRNVFVDVTGHSVFRTIFNQYGLYVDGKLKYGWNGGNNATSYEDTLPSSNADPFTGAALTAATAWLDGGTGQLATPTENVTYPAGDRSHQVVLQYYSDGSYLQWDNYALEPAGAVAAGFGNPTASAFERRLLDFNHEQVVTSSHFGGRRIELNVQPKILVQTGLTQAGLQRQ